MNDGEAVSLSTEDVRVALYGSPDMDGYVDLKLVIRLILVKDRITYECGICEGNHLRTQWPVRWPGVQVACWSVEMSSMTLY